MNYMIVPLLTRKISICSIDYSVFTEHSGDDSGFGVRRAVSQSLAFLCPSWVTGDKLSSLKLHFLISEKGGNSSIYLPGLLWELHDLMQLRVQQVLVTITIMGTTQLLYCCYNKDCRTIILKPKSMSVRKSCVSNSNFIAKAHHLSYWPRLVFVTTTTTGSCVAQSLIHYAHWPFSNG